MYFVHTLLAVVGTILPFFSRTPSATQADWVDEETFRFLKAKKYRLHACTIVIALLLLYLTMILLSLLCRYRPIRFVLRPGELILLPKGRLHAFRKALPVDLPPTDCHYQLHNNARDEIDGKDKQWFQCSSFTWDFIHLGMHRLVPLLYFPNQLSSN